MNLNYDDSSRIIATLLGLFHDERGKGRPVGFYGKRSPQIFLPENLQPDTGDKNVTDETQRHNAGKPELSYILEFEDALDEVAKVCMAGALKYARGNWKKGGENVSLESLMDSLMRHAKARMKGEKFDRELHVRHLAQVVWNGLAALYWELENETFALNALDQDGEAKD